jgi:putative transposase
MARAPRIERPNAWYHVTARGIERRPIFRHDRDRSHFCDLLAEFVSRFGAVLHAYVLMENHYHLLVETPKANLSQAMQWLNVSYTVWFNRRRQRCGPLLQGRFKAVIFDPLESGLLLSRYVHLNPVRIQSLGLDKQAQGAQRRGLSPAPERKMISERLQTLRQHRWSSWPAYAGLSQRPEWLQTEGILSCLGKGCGNPNQAYRRYVEEAIREGLEQSPWENVKEQVVLGSARFLQSLRHHWRGDERESPGLKRLRGLPTWSEAVSVVERLRGKKWEDFRDLYGDWARDLALYLGRKRCGLKLKDLGEKAGGIDYASVSGAIRRLEQHARVDKKMRKLIHEALRQIANEKT